MRPLRLHLDSSDYAAMYRAQPATPEAQVRDELIRLAGSGQIEIGLSYHVFFELMQKAEPRFREDRLARARLLKTLCRKNALPYPTDLGAGFRFSNDGLWVPRIDLEEIEIENILQKTMQGIATRTDLNPHQRKALSKKKYFAEWVRYDPLTSEWLLIDHWPLPFGASFVANGGLRSYILGKLTAEEANDKLRFYITDPEEAYKTWFEIYKRDNPVLERRDDVANTLTVMLRQITQMVTEAASLKKDIKLAINTRGEDKLNEEARSHLVEQNSKVEALVFEMTQLDEISEHPAWVTKFGVDGARIAAEIFYGLYGRKRDVIPSDAIDLAHALYLPHVDLWRGDKAFSDLLIKNRVRFCERVVPTLPELIGRIEKEGAKT